MYLGFGGLILNIAIYAMKSVFWYYFGAYV